MLSPWAWHKDKVWGFSIEHREYESCDSLNATFMLKCKCLVETKLRCVLLFLRESCPYIVKKGLQGEESHSECSIQVCINCDRTRIYSGSELRGRSSLLKISRAKLEHHSHLKKKKNLTWFVFLSSIRIMQSSFTPS